MPRSVTLLLMCAAFCLVLAGCWDRRELNELGITSATGIDWADGKWNVTYQVVVPSGMWSGGGGGGGGGTTQSSVHVFTAEGRTLCEAANKSNLEIPRQLYFAHTDAIVIGKAAAEHGLSEVVDLYLRSVQARETVMMAVTEGRASDILKLFVPLEKLPGDALNKIISKEELNSGYYPAVRVFDFAQSLYSDSRAIGVPELNLMGKRDAKSRKELSSLESFKQTHNESKLGLTGESVFKDGRRIGRLTFKESYGISWLSGDIKQSALAVPCPSGSNRDAFSTLRIDKAETKITPQKKQDGFRMLVRVNVSGEVLESECKLDLTKNEAVRQLGNAIEREIEDIMDTGWSAAMRIKADLPGFADKIHRKYPNDWKKLKDQWTEQFPKLEVQPHIRVSVIRIGLSLKPLKQDRENAKG
ncbi:MULTISPECIES: Ger(x)C family spore germination protein [Cohnella]|uniref:Ger(x)C family spore germination protein n=1 Tax=Cohnella TaxID=329857 RepID=UPI0009B970A3|nr:MULTISPECIES: Ger(x)C family spore germination protein [Cohnella]MBN2983754.1 Ger(x)C family spore germination protein [Cohnella algarum]